MVFMATDSRRDGLSGGASAAAAALLWGVNYPVSKWVLQVVPEGQFLVLRFVLAVGLFFAVLRLRGESLAVSRKEGFRAALLGLVCVGVYNILWTLGIHRTSSSTSALLISSSPLLAAIWCLLFRVEPVRPARWVGLLLGFSGVFFIVEASGGLFAGDGTVALGNALTLCAALLFALYAILAKPLLANHSPTKVTTLAMAWGLPVLLPFGLIRTPLSLWVLPPAAVLRGFLYVLFAGTLGAYIFWYRGVQRIGPVSTVLFHFLTPCVSLVVAPFLLGDAGSPAKFAGAFLVFLGILADRLPPGLFTKRTTYTEPATRERKTGPTTP